jgi:hypothetical protein
VKRHLLILLALGAAWVAWQHSGGVDATLTDAGAFDYPGYRITPLEEFTLEARVLSRKDYRHDREAQLAPTDLALGWGPMATDAVLAEIDVSQGNRWYFWRASRLPIPERDINRHSANVHVIAASPEAAAILARVRRDDRVRLAGKLVEVRSDDGWRWRSSLSRTDTGAGSCELLWLEGLEIL